MIIKDDTLTIIMACKLRELREQAGLSQADLGAIVGLSRVSICNIEAAERTMTPTLIFKFCAVFNCDYSELFPLDEHQPELFKIKNPTPEEKQAERIRKMKQRLARIARGGKK